MDKNAFNISPIIKRIYKWSNYTKNERKESISSLKLILMKEKTLKKDTKYPKNLKGLELLYIKTLNVKSGD